LILSETWGRKVDASSDAVVGPMCQREKRREGRTGSGGRRDGPWAIFPVWARVCPEVLFFFLFSFPFFFSEFV
jgi:hypothetical protein